MSAHLGTMGSRDKAKLLIFSKLCNSSCFNDNITISWRSKLDLSYYKVLSSIPTQRTSDFFYIFNFLFSFHLFIFITLKFCSEIVAT